MGRLLQQQQKIETLQHGAVSSSKPSLGAGTTSKPAVEDSTRGKEEPTVRHLPVVISSTSFSGTSNSGKPLQGASSLSTPAERECLIQPQK
jgi:hypothetical protein